VANLDRVSLAPFRCAAVTGGGRRDFSRPGSNQRTSTAEPPTGERSSDRSRRVLLAKGVAGLFGLLLVGATLAPVVQHWRPEPKDSFPFSHYPMFSQKRDSLYRVSYMVGLDGQGNRHLIPHGFAGRGGFNQTRRQINRFIRDEKADTLCQAVALNVARDTTAAYRDIVEVRIVTGAFRYEDFFRGNKTPAQEQARASCRIVRGDQAVRGKP
jgi:hypothetical protein